MDELIRLRGRIKGKLTRICSFGEQCDANAASAVEIQIKLEMLAEIWADFETTQSKIECECQDSDLVTQQQEQEDFEAKFCMIKAKLITASAQSSTPGVIGITRTERPNVKLPAIELPVFTGDYKKWAAFSDLFQSIIHQNTSLSSVQKLHYLKSSIRGEASGLLNSMAITEANYLEAWKILSDRYSNRRQVIQSHLKSMYSQVRLTSESSGELRKLLDVTVENVRALHALDLPTDEWDCLLVFLVTDRLDSTSRRHWELSLGDAQNPTFEDLKDFIEKRCRALEATGPLTKVTAASTKSLNVKTPRRPIVTYHATSEVCVKCKGKHPLHSCEQFRKLTVEQRIELVKSTSLCFNCMKSGHISRECKLSHCKKCNQRHSTFLHRETAAVETPADTDGSTVQGLHSNTRVSPTQILLATAIVNVKDFMGSAQSVRALLDSGSQATFITEACVQRLGLKRQKTNVTISGVGATSMSTCRGMVQLPIFSTQSSYSCNIRALVMQQITGIMPCEPVESKCLATLIEKHQLELADPNYHHPGSIDLLIGADVYFDLLLSGKLKEVNSSTIIQNTNLGWVISGPVKAQGNLVIIASHLAYQELDQQLKKFWEMEEVPNRRLLTNEEIICEEHFVKTHSRNTEGRFVVRLPFQDNCENLGDTSNLAKKRLLQMERKLQGNIKCRSEYNSFLAEYLDLNHMEEVKQENQSIKYYYLPHHYVLKESSSTTRLRVVFDGTASPTFGLSLNQALLVGPTIQEDLVSIVMRFRLHNIVFTADIAKMYRQVLVHPDDCCFQSILWRDSPSQPIKHYQLNTVTYGTASAPFLATRCLVELSNMSKSSHPKAAEVIRRDFYVDDLMSGADTLEEALELQRQLIELLSSGGFGLRKWSSNTHQLVEALPEHLRSHDHALKLDGDAIKTLGIQWQPVADQFSFRVAIESPDHITKRSVLSQIAKLFDPLGWLAPVVVSAKILIQRLWLLGIGWDEALAPNFVTEWNQFQQELRAIEKIIIPRCMVIDSVFDTYQLHGFCDASEKAFGAVIFIRSGNHPTINLVCSRSKVAPLKRVSLPRLELCGALLLARLLKQVSSTLGIESVKLFAWTDSTIVLSWLRKPPHLWKTFVANRVAEIQDLLSPEHWKHVSSGDNPADCLSRGLSPNLLPGFNLWWNGPPWLSFEESRWPSNLVMHDTIHPDIISETRRSIVEVYVSSLKTPIAIENYSHLSKLIRITSYCRRFISNCRANRDDRSLGFLSSGELQSSLLYLIKQVQYEVFAQEIQCCLNNNTQLKGSLSALCPFIDGQGLLRVGGRLHHSRLAYDQRHPLILPHHQLTVLIIRNAHISNLHAGPQLLQAILHRNYWIIKCKHMVRNVVHKCVQCFRHKAITSQQLMGSLPQDRVEPVRAFFRCGVDYAGPFLLKLAKGRGNGRTHKSYVCVFVCFTTKALHIELANDLSTSSFIAALRRFCARRGKPSDIYSDCGTNFVGADHQLHELHKLLISPSHNQQVSDILTNAGVNWHFNPPSAPNFGGLWEAGVKSIKFHLRRIIGTTSLTYEEMYTTLTQIEACLNSRPLCPVSSDPSDLTALTPGHFLIGDVLVAPPDQDVTKLETNRLTRWKLVQRLYQNFWKRWSSEYLARLQQRPKWVKPSPNIAIGDLVLLKEKEISPLCWPLARVVTLHPGDDGLVRVVTVRTAKGTLKRPCNKCCILPMES